MNKWLGFLTFFSLALLGTNIFLVTKENSKVDRLHYVRDWDKVTTGDLESSFPVKGVVVPAVTEHITVDQHARFQEFLVKEGERVDAGTPVFRYKSDDVERQIAQLDAEISSLKKKKDSLSASINDYNTLLKSLGNSNANSTYIKSDNPYDEWIPGTAANDEKNKLAIEQAIIEKNIELEKTDADIRKYEEQRAAVEGGRDGLTVMSPIEGIVKSISDDLKNPVMTIFSNEKAVKGQLDERQIAKVDEGMKAKIISQESKSPVNGKVADIGELPENEPTTENPSFYPVTVEYESDNEKMFIGRHVTVNIITDEANNVPIVPGMSVRKERPKSYVWVMNKHSSVEKREVDTGLTVDHLSAIKSGLQPGETIVLDHRHITAPGKYITPFKPREINKQDRKEISRKRALKCVLIGILQR